MTMRTRIGILLACAAALCGPSSGQPPPVTILQIEYDNVVFYNADIVDPAKLATSPLPSSLPAGMNRLFKLELGLGDVVTVNGKPAKGLYVLRCIPFLFSTAHTPGRAIADINGWGVFDSYVVILGPDGIVIGTIMTMGVGGMAPPPGMPAGAIGHNLTITGGTGVFLGARGQASTKSVSAAGRTASMTEDPAYRRLNGGGKRSEIFHLIPMTWPEVLALPTGPVIYHGDDFSLVSEARPARAGEVLIMGVSGLGPVKPNLGPGTPFPAFEAGTMHEVNSPVTVTVGGREADVLNKVGWPGMTNVYRVDFRVPEDTPPGMATVGVAVAWINGSTAQIPVRRAMGYSSLPVQVHSGPARIPVR